MTESSAPDFQVAPDNSVPPARKKWYIVLAIVGLVTLIGAVGVGGFVAGKMSATRAYAEARRPTEIAIFLCSGTQVAIYGSCKAEIITESQKSDVRNVLHQLAGDSCVRLISQEEAYAWFRQRFPGMTREEAESGIVAEDLPESFVLPYSGPENFAEIKAAVSEMPGVEAVVARRSNGNTCVTR